MSKQSCIDVGAILQKYEGSIYTQALHYMMMEDVRNAYQCAISEGTHVGDVPSAQAISAMVRAHAGGPETSASSLSLCAQQWDSDVNGQLRETMESGPKPGSRWRHYKGGIYTIVCTAIDEETTSPRVIYKAEDGIIWSRNGLAFFGTVVTENGPVPRFTAIG